MNISTISARAGERQRNSNIDAIKGIGIVLMVWGHCAAPFTHFVYLFHMAIFFMASGYLWNDKYSENTVEMKKFIIKRLKSLWLPFVVCNLVFTILNNTFIDIGIYTVNEQFLQLVTGSNQQLAMYFNFKDLIFAVLKNLLFIGQTQLGAATWFLRTLFIVSICHLIVRFIGIHLSKEKVVTVIAISLAIIGAMITNFTKLELPAALQNCFAAYIAFVLGVYIRKFSLMTMVSNRKLPVGIISFAVLILLNFIGNIGMSTGQITSVLFFCTASISGWLLLWVLSDVLPQIIKKLFIYLGQHTLWIVLLHFLSFKAVTYVYLLLTKQDMLLLASHPAIENVNWLWVVYLFIGLLLPVICESLVKKIYRAVRGNK
ncbi:MAG: acyltransferase family protein [Acutalibacteraceae bacterium]